MASSDVRKLLGSLGNIKIKKIVLNDDFK